MPDTNSDDEFSIPKLSITVSRSALESALERAYAQNTPQAADNTATPSSTHEHLPRENRPITTPEPRAAVEPVRRGAACAKNASQAADDTATSSSSTGTYKPPTKYRFIKDNWGNRPMFQYSHGLRMDPEDFEEGELILEGYMESNRQQHEHDASRGKGDK